MWDFVVNTTIKIKINHSNCSNWFYLILNTCFGPHLGPSSGSLIEYVSCYWTVLICIYISVNSSQSHNTCNGNKIARIFLFLTFLKNFKLFKILLSFNLTFYLIFVFLSRILYCTSPRVSLLYYLEVNYHVFCFLSFGLFVFYTSQDMRLHEDGSICGPKQVATIKYKPREKFDWFMFIFIVVFKAKSHRPWYGTACKHWRYTSYPVHVVKACT
jgi:hypothetical protein